MFVQTNIDKYRFQTMLLLAAIAVYPFVHVFQGIDFTDFGFAATNYKFIFSNPESIYTTFFPIYLANVLGGLVYLAFGGLGLIVFKIVYVLEVYLMCYLLYRLFVQYFDAKTVLISILVSSIYINYYPYGTLNWLNYNDLSALFYLVAALLLFSGLERKVKSYLLVAGVCIGLNFFIRVSNLAGLALFAVIVIDHIRNGESFRSLPRKLVLFGSGVLLGIAAVISLMLALGHFAHYAASFSLIRDFKSLTPSHNMGSNLLLYFYDLFQSLLTATYFILIGLAILQFTKLVSLKNRYLLTIIGVCIAFVVVKYDFRILSKIREYYHVRWIFWQSGVVVLMLLYILYKSYKDKSWLFNAALLGLIILVITPMGSGRSFLNANYGLWLGLPLTIAVFLDNKAFALNPSSLSESSRFLFNLIIVSTVAFYAINANYHELYRDTPDRLQLTEPVGHDYFRGTYTGQARAASIRELMQAIPRHVKRSDYVLGHEYLSMANYITDCPPYMYNPNPMFFSADLYRFLYLKARKEIPLFPVILSAKGLLDNNWPHNTAQGLNRTDPERQLLAGRQRDLIESLKQEGRYNKVWENNFFEIWRSDGEL